MKIKKEIILVGLALIAFTGYFVWNKKQKSNSLTSKTTETTDVNEGQLGVNSKQQYVLLSNGKAWYVPELETAEVLKQKVNQFPVSLSVALVDTYPIGGHITLDTDKSVKYNNI